jgi:hypothetical protein
MSTTANEGRKSLGGVSEQGTATPNPGQPFVHPLFHDLFLADHESGSGPADRKRMRKPAVRSVRRAAAAAGRTAQGWRF